MPGRHRRRSWSVRLPSLAAALAVVALSAGCGNGTSIRSPFAAAPRPLADGPAWEVRTGTVDGLGTVLVDGRGLTLYVFAHDRPGRPPTCYGICAVQWPPVLLTPDVGRPVAGPGIHADLLATTTRRDGPVQVTYAGWPLYTWPPDRQPGQATGQALANGGGRWWVLGPDGRPITTPRA